MQKRLLLLNGPNINRLGKREEDIYGTFTLKNVENTVRSLLKKHEFELDSLQSNSEGDLIDILHESEGKYIGIIFNPAAYSHTSIALHDAIKSIETPVVEVHISNIYNRESYRHKSLTAPACVGQITGLGLTGYVLAASYFLNDK